jgi:hypothetical protein
VAPIRLLILSSERTRCELGTLRDCSANSCAGSSPRPAALDAALEYRRASTPAVLHLLNRYHQLFLVQFPRTDPIVDRSMR